MAPQNTPLVINQHINKKDKIKNIKTANLLKEFNKVEKINKDVKKQIN